MERRRFLKKTGFWSTLLLLGSKSKAFDLGANRSKRPNILIVQADQHRASAMSHREDSFVKTPNFDSFAKQGISFPNAVSQSPVCSPMRGTFQTGMYSHKNGVVENDMRLSPDLTTFAEVFGQAGYSTGYIGKWHLDGGFPKVKPGGFVPKERRQGWQEWYGHEKGHSYNTVWKYDEMGERHKVKEYNWEPYWQNDVALDFIKKNKEENKPWLFYVSYGPPHLPNQCPQKFMDMYDSNKFEFPPTANKAFSKKAMKYAKKLVHYYYAQVTAIDEAFGRLMQGLKELDAEHDTVVIYTSDHGDKLGAHANEIKDQPTWKKVRGKARPYKSAFNIPFIVRWPERIKSGQVCPALISSVDFAPTLIDFAGLKIPESMQGISMASWCLSGKGPIKQAVYLGLGGLQGERNWPIWRAVWDGRYVFSTLSQKVLYDHKKDPEETENLYDSPEYKNVRNALGRIMLELAEKTDDPALPLLKK